MRKRFMITMDEQVHRELTLEAVRQGRTVGELIGGLMDPTVRRAIEPEQVKETNGKLSKGLGTIPGQEPPKPVVDGQGIAGGVYSSRPFSPAKPGKGKS